MENICKNNINFNSKAKNLVGFTNVLMRSVKELSTLGEMYVPKAEVQLHCLIKLLVKSLGYKVVELFREI